MRVASPAVQGPMPATAWRRARACSGSLSEARLQPRREDADAAKDVGPPLLQTQRVVGVVGEGGEAAAMMKYMVTASPAGCGMPAPAVQPRGRDPPGDRGDLQGPEVGIRERREDLHAHRDDRERPGRHHRRHVGGFANAVEKGLAMLIPPVLGFIADYFSLGDLPKMVAKQIKSFREWILGKIEAGFDWLIEKGKALLAKLGIGKKQEEKKEGEAPIGEDVEFEAEGEPHHIWVTASGTHVTVMVASRVETLEIFLKSEAVKLAKEANPAVDNLVSEAKRPLNFIQNNPKAAFCGRREENSGRGTRAREIYQANHGTPDRSRKAVRGPTRRDLKVSGSNEKKPRESHHVPAKAFGKAMREFIQNMARALNRDPFFDSPQADPTIDKLNARAEIYKELTAGDADQLSAISLTKGAHRSEQGVHAVKISKVQGKLARQEEAIMAAKRTTKNECGQYFSVIRDGRDGARLLPMSIAR